MFIDADIRWAAIILAGVFGVLLSLCSMVWITEVKKWRQLVQLYLEALAGKQLSRPWLGVRYQVLDTGVAQANKLSVDNGAWITSGTDSTGATTPAVETGSPAEKAGLRENDVITAVDGTTIDINNPLIELLAEHQPGSTVTLTVQRGSQSLARIHKRVDEDEFLHDGEFVQSTPGIVCTPEENHRSHDHAEHQPDVLLIHTAAERQPATGRETRDQHGDADE